jgi:hypothetical protein
MRHWLAGSLSSVTAHCEGRMLARENPVLFRDLPESFKVGHPLPQKVVGAYCRDDREQRTLRRCIPTKPRFVHGCELLPVN